ncbi:MAG: ketol-acid reductoisomerase [Planctomycetaceae bacterium]|nr:ketol-acid reductoisomerase [Planctomycetaceae bacterium]
MAVEMLYEKDGSMAPLQDKTIAVLGYGSQGHGHAQNARESGVNVIVAQREGSHNYDLAKENGFDPVSIADAVKQADMMIITLPDEVQPQIYEKEIAPNLRPGQTLCFTHGFNIHFKTIVPPDDVNVIMVAPKGPGHLVRAEFVKGGGVPCLICVEQDPSGDARDVALAWAIAIGGARAGVIVTTFQDETETDLFGEQSVLCGGLSAMIKAGFEVLVEAGYEPELAYFEVCHELKLIVDLIYQGGLDYMRYSISNTAEWGDLYTGPKIIDDHVKDNMKKALAEIQDGTFAKGWRAEYEQGMKDFKARYEADRAHGVETTGRQLRAMMPWLDPKTVPGN